MLYKRMLSDYPGENIDSDRREVIHDYYGGFKRTDNVKRA